MSLMCIVCADLIINLNLLFAKCGLMARVAPEYTIEQQNSFQKT